jgi:hypothetical protein
MSSGACSNGTKFKLSAQALKVTQAHDQRNLMTITNTPLSGVVTGSHDIAGDLLLADILLAIEEHIDVEGYVRARAKGATHNEVIGARDAGFGVGLYTSIRRSGATHGEALELHGTGFPYAWYIRERNLGATHTTALERANSLPR